MNPDDKAKLVAAWIECQTAEQGPARHEELFWSFSQLWELTRTDPGTAFDVILTILHADDSSTIAEVLSAGPLESLLVYHGPTIIERIENEAARDPSFRHLLGGVWKNSMAGEVWERVQACWDRRGWDGIPE